MSLLQLGLSTLAVLALGLIAWWLGLGGNLIEDEAGVRKLAEGALSGFEAGDVVLSPDRKAAVAFGTNRDVAVVRKHGGMYVSRHLLSPLQLHREGTQITVATGERWFGDFHIVLADEAQAVALAEQLTQV